MREHAVDPDRRRRARRPQRPGRRAARRGLRRSTPSTAARRASSGSSRQPYDVVVLDIWLPGMDGLATLARMRERQIDAAGRRSSPATATSSRRCARSRWARSTSSRSRCRSRRRCWSCATRCASGGSRPRTRRCARKVDAQHTMVGESHAMAQLREQIAMAAPTNGRVLIFGENGTGKELVARNIHAHEPAAHGAVRRGELRGDSRGADRERAVRPRARRVHRRRRRSPRQVRAGARRHDLPRRDRRHEPEDAGQGAARAAGAGDGAGRRLDAHPRRRARARRHQQGPDRGDPGRAVPRGSVLPPERRPDLRAAAARAPRGHPAAGATTSWRCWRASTAAGRRRSSPRRWRCCGATPGRATCASCATWSSA